MLSYFCLRLRVLDEADPQVTYIKLLCIVTICIVIYFSIYSNIHNSRVCLLLRVLDGVLKPAQTLFNNFT
jgi:hypothetical protein